LIGLSFAGGINSEMVFTFELLLEVSVFRSIFTKGVIVGKGLGTIFVALIWEALIFSADGGFNWDSGVG
tara:strand:- start:1264 stop:1470 length:207 start_codon:yes stop_codon:yes gene_type:complete